MQKHYCILSLLLLILYISGITSITWAQDANEDYERFSIGEMKEIHSSISLSPKNDRIVAVSGNKSSPVYLYNWESDDVINSFNVENWYAGSSVEHSSNGKYLILNQLFYVDWAVNRDKKVLFVIIDNNGSKVLKIDESNEVKINPEESRALSLSGDKITEYDLSTGKAVNTFNLPRKGFSFDISSDGRFIAISHEPVEEDLKKRPEFKKDKQALKFILKYKNQVTIYKYPSFEVITTVNEFYDLIYELKFREDDSQLFCLQIPHAKAQTSVSSQQSYLNIINATGWEPIRKGFVSKATYQPDFKLSQDGRFFGIISKGMRYSELHIYDYNSRKLLDRFEFSFRLFDSDEDGLIATDIRPSFVFLPDTESILIAIGNRIIKWKFKQQ